VHTGEDAAKMILAGADVTQMCSALLKNGIRHIETVLSQLVDIGRDKGYDSIDQMRGVMSQKNCAEPAAFERANYMKALTEYRLVGTGE
jgi:dihydroorotate dehydrogenase (fumarate)